MKGKNLKVIVKYDKDDYNDNENKIIDEQIKRIKRINDKIALAMNIKVKNHTRVKIEEGPFYLIL